MGKAFDGDQAYYFADWRLRITTGSARWFPEFTPMNLMALRFIFALMKRFIRHDICCHVGGSFPTYLAGMQTNFNRVTIFIALKKRPACKFNFLKRWNTPGIIFCWSLPFRSVPGLTAYGRLQVCCTPGRFGMPCIIYGCRLGRGMWCPVECRLCPLYLEDRRGAIRVQAAHHHHPSRPRVCRNKAVVSQTLQRYKCRVVLRLGLWHVS